MSSADIVPLLAMILYLCQAVVMLTQHQYGFSFMWFAYAMANVGVLFAQKGN